MYCSACGTKLQVDLNYCNRCGQRVGPDTEKSSLAESLSSSLGYVGSAGFIAYIFVVIALVKNGVPGNQVMGITAFYFAALLGICFLILRQAQLFSGKNDRGGQSRHSEQGDTPYLKPVTTAQLEEAREPGISSIVENTTRTLDEVRVERR
jgi:hypothetical protein